MAHPGYLIDHPRLDARTAEDVRLRVPGLDVLAFAHHLQAG